MSAVSGRWLRRERGFVSGLRAELQEIVERLLQEHADQITLDQIGDAIGVRAVSTGEVDAMIDALEAAGREVAAGDKPRGEEHLHQVIRSIRELSAQLGRRPSQAEIAEHAGLTAADVSHALQLARIMQR